MKEAITVSQLNRYIKELVSDDRVLNNVIVRGEVSNLRESRNNYYFMLKDETSTIQCIVFTSFSGSSVDVNVLKDGLEILVEGKVAVYEKGGTYAIYVTNVKNIGLGDYFIKLEALKQKLYELGMFDSSYKKAIPKYAKKIGVVTAKNGAAIKDIYKTIKNKNPYAEVILYPSLVQGENAYQSIIDGIMELDNRDLDVIIIGRGGGSIEDLYVFNDERLAYAIFNAKTPIISAVGHEINDSISDLVSDLRVATPTAAGEAATFDYYEFENDLENYKLTLDSIIENRIADLRTNINNRKENLMYLSPRAKLNRMKDMVIDRKERLNSLLNYKIDSIKKDILRYIEKLKARNILDKMKSGMAYVKTGGGNKILTVDNVKIGDTINVKVIDGNIKSKVYAINKY